MHYARFCAEVVSKQRVYTFTDVEELLIYPIRGGEVVPFWSSHSRLLRIANAHPKYARHSISQYTMPEFDKWLIQLQDENLLVGVNWAGPRLVGFNVTVEELRASMQSRSAPSS